MIGKGICMFVVDLKALADVGSLRANGLTVTDADGDGATELLVAAEAGPNRVLKWQDGALVDIADPVIADVGGTGRGFLAADIDGDGREELYLLNGASRDTGETSRDRLFASFGKRWMDLIDLPENAGGATLLTDGGGAAVDRFGHGRYGFYIIGNGGSAHLFELGPRGYLVDSADDAGLDLVADARAAAVLPLGSHRMDIFVAVADGPNRLYRNVGDGDFEEIAVEKAVADPRNPSHAVAVFDADGDGLFDLLAVSAEGPHRLFLQRAGMAFVEGANSDLEEPCRATTVVVADFDNDGYEELFIQVDGEPNRLFGWRNDEWQAISIGDAAEAKLSAGGAVAADIDGDGKLELILSHGGGQDMPLSLFRPFVNPNHHWLRVLPLTAHGAPARGITVACLADGRWQRRVICGGTGHLCQSEPVAHFGLGTCTNVERIEIWWPDSVVVVIEDPPVDRVLTVSYPPE